MTKAATPTGKKRGRKPNPSSKDPGPVQSLTRGLALLERLAEEKDGVSLTDLAQQVGLAASTAHRLLNTLERSGYVYQDQEIGRWYVGVKAFVVGTAFVNHRDIAALARPVLHQLMEDSGETTNLVVLSGTEAVMIAQVECHEIMRMVVPIGTRMPLHASGVGKALLATLSDSEVNALIQSKGLQQFTEYTLGTTEQLKAELHEVRRLGYAFDKEEHAIGLRCVAAPIFNELHEPVGGVSVSGPRSRVPDGRIAELGRLTTQAADRITQQLGGEFLHRTSTAQ